jgi:ubiquinone/menaquinone biosynthesis C-methylase UbiE
LLERRASECRMREVSVSRDAVLAGYDALADIYGHVPPLIMWRAWELAGYRRYRLPEPVLDVGCGDGRFFRRVFPDISNVVGVDLSECVVEAARQSHVYRAVHVAPAHALPLPAEAVASVFANCALEHMDHLDQVLAEISRVLRPGGVFLLSVVTDTLVSWAPLRKLLEACHAAEAGRSAQARHEAYHHLINALPCAQWVARCERAGFRPLEWTPIAQGPAGWLFLLLDQLWHIERQGGGEFGDCIAERLLDTPNRRSGLRRMFEALLDMSMGASDHTGLILWLEK